MNDNTQIHELAAPNVKSGKIRFISHLDDDEHEFCSCINSKTGERMTWVDDEEPCTDMNEKMVQAQFDRIRVNEQVLEVIGDF